MKKMVCEICGSQSIKKENGVFVCQECGTEYSVEEAKKLLKEVETSAILSEESKQLAPERCANGDELLKQLYAWLGYIESLDGWFYYVKHSRDQTFSEFKSSDVSETPLNIRVLQPWMFNSSICFEKKVDSGQFLPTAWPARFFVNLASENKYLGIDDFERAGRDNILKHYIKASSGEIYNVDSNFSLYNDKDIDFILKQPKGTTFKCLNTVETVKYGFFKDTKEISQVPWEIADKMETGLNNIKKMVDLYYEFYETSFVAFEEKYHENIENIKKLLDRLPQMEKLLNIPIKYREKDTVYSLIEIVLDGRADTWKELINIYKQEKYQACVIRSFDNVSARLGSLSDTFERSFKTIGEKIDDVCACVNNSIRIQKESNECLKRIMFDTRYSLISNLIK